MESDGKKGSAQQVPDGGQVGNGHIVWVLPPPPDKVDQPLGDVQQQHHLSTTTITTIRMMRRIMMRRSATVVR